MDTEERAQLAVTRMRLETMAAEAALIRRVQPLAHPASPSNPLYHGCSMIISGCREALAALPAVPLAAPQARVYGS